MNNNKYSNKKLNQTIKKLKATDLFVFASVL